LGPEGLAKVLVFSSIGLNGRKGKEASMQMIAAGYWYFVLIAGLVVQGVWMLLTRWGRERYIRSITNFRKPSSASEQFYGWHLSAPGNVVLEAIIVDSAIVLLVLYVTFTQADMSYFMGALPVLALVMILSIVAPIQTARRVGGLVRIEKELYDNINAATDKVSQVRTVIDNLLNPLQVPDGRYWFALFRIALTEDPVGWSARDVLMEKAKELDMLAERVRRGERVPMKSTGSERGAEIE